MDFVEHEEVRYTSWNGEFGYVGLDYMESERKKVRTKRFYVPKIYLDKAENDPPKLRFLYFLIPQILKYKFNMSGSLLRSLRRLQSAMSSFSKLSLWDLLLEALDVLFRDNFEPAQ